MIVFFNRGGLINRNVSGDLIFYIVFLLTIKQKEGQQKMLQQTFYLFNGRLILKFTTQPNLEIDTSREKAPAFKKWLDR
jgi:hypothetical protein